MRAMILAAGRGERMRPLTDTCPKPLLEAGGKPLIVHQIERLVGAGIRELVINHAHLGAMIEAALGDGTRFGASIAYSPEPPGALETAGGIRHALPLLGEAPFLVVNGDVFCDWDLAQATPIDLGDRLAHLVLTDNPPQHPDGDFLLAGDRVHWCEPRPQGTEGPPRGSLTPSGGGRREAAARGPSEGRWLTFTGIGIYRPQLFAALPDNTPHKLRYPLREAAAQGLVSGEHFCGRWLDVGTPERLAALDQELSQ